MSFEITCPYCFGHMEDGEVLFRSEKVHNGSIDPEIIPEEYDDIYDFQNRYKGADKAAIAKKYQEWEFFVEQEDAVYEAFWKKYSGTTEYNPADEAMGIKSYHRRVIDPGNEKHQPYIESEDGSYLLRDAQNMVTGVKLRSGEKCYRRVCPHCHNPLPNNYGKYPVKFSTVIGITGAGKTIYLSQLLRSMGNYAVKAGLSAHAGNASVRAFLEKNPVIAKKPLPGSTPEGGLQQPLFYELAHPGMGGAVVTETFVLYDVAGELFREENVDKLPNFAPFIEHSHGIILLIDPLQFAVFDDVDANTSRLSDTVTALNAIQNIINKGNLGDKIKTPLAICLSKADLAPVQAVLGEDLNQLLLDDVHGLRDVNGIFKTIFNAQEYAPIGKKLMQFMAEHDSALNQNVFTSYENYAYFAFTSLGCAVEKEGNGKNAPQYPVGPVMPKRIEEPLLWMFYKLGYITPNWYVPGEISCPSCHAAHFSSIPEAERAVEEKLSFFRKRTIYSDLVCDHCGYRWDGGQT